MADNEREIDVTAPEAQSRCLNELVGPEIGSNEDFAKEALRKEMWKTLEKGEREQSTSVSRSNLMREGFHAGFSAAADDFVNGRATVEHFEKLREHRDISDFYALGFELGYYRKLAELLIN